VVQVWCCIRGGGDGRLLEGVLLKTRGKLNIFESNLSYPVERDMMTIAISIKVNDGIVLAADSASTIMGQGPTGNSGVINVYNNANKLFNLYKGLPVGAITWGSGSIGKASISTMAKDFRKVISQDNEWRIDPNSYTIEDISSKFKKFMYDDGYVESFKSWEKKPSLGFMIVGYSSNMHLAEEWSIKIDNGECTGPSLVRNIDQVGLTANGMPEAISRLYSGYSTRLPNVLKKVGLDDPMIERIITSCRHDLAAPLVIPPMSIQDVIDLAIFLVETTINFTKFSPGAPSVGGPIEVAAITKHEGFKWVQRKHYFSRDFNQRLGD